MKFHQNISTRCKIINILVFCEYVYKVKLAILGLHANNFAMSKDILMKLWIQRALYYGSELWKNHGIFLTIKVLFGPFSLRLPLLKIIPKSLVTLQFLSVWYFKLKLTFRAFKWDIICARILSGRWSKQPKRQTQRTSVQFVFCTTVC